MKSNLLTLFIWVITIIFSSNAISQTINNETALEKKLMEAQVPEYQYQVISTYPHDRNSFTEGLFFQNGFLYESTGLYGKSLLRMIELDTAKIFREYSLPKTCFGEGMTILDDKLYQLTWRENTGFIYDKNTFQLKRNFTFEHEGWGLTTDGSYLIMSDGSSVLSWIDPVNFKIVKSVSVNVRDNKIHYINELEYIDGLIYANVWPTSIILVIAPQNGNVQGWFNIKTLKPHAPCNDCVANGIAYNNQDKILYLTGKLWPSLFAVRVLPTT